MYNFLTKNGQLYAFLLGAISTIIVVGSIIGNANKALLDSPEAAKMAPEIANTGILNTGLNITVLLLVVALGATIIFGLLGLVTDFKGSLKFIAGFAVMIIAFFVLKATSDHEAVGKISETMQTFDISAGLSKGISAAIKGTIGMAVVAIGSMIIFEIINIFK